MAINVTVTGSPISVRGRSKMVLSDLENMKKTEREHRRRLRLEQVNEQTKAFSRRILERAKRIEQEELSRLQNEDSKIKRAHNKRLAEYHRRLQDIENIGYAHENAAKQPDIEMIKQAEEERNKALARARGTDAIQRLQETNKVVSPRSKQQERLQAIRDFENERSRMVAQLPKQTTVENESIQFSENDHISKSAPLPSSKKRPKCVIHKKTPVRKLSKQKSRSSTTKSPSRVSVAVDSEELNKIPSASTSSSRKNENESLNKPCNVPMTISGQTSCNLNQEQKRVQICESDDNEPRKIVPSSLEKPEKLPKCHHDNSSCSDLSSTSVSSSSVSESSCFSESTSKVTAIRKTPRHATPVDSKIQLYDHKTRQRNVYDTPSGLVQKLNIKNQPNAEDLAREITELENREFATLASQQDNSKQRSKDAMLRDKIRRDYDALVKNLDLLTKEERRIKASQVASAANKPIPVPSKKRDDDSKRQKKMDRAFQNILRSSQKPNSYNSQTERPITITPRDYLHEPTPTTARRDQNSSDDQVNGEICSEEDDENYNAHKGMVCDLLLKIEKLKKILLQEYGADLPDTVFNASVKSLFNQTVESSGRGNYGSNGIKSKTPEIQVINMSGNEEAHKSVRKFTATNNNKNKKGRPPTPGKALPKTSTASTSTSTGSSGSSNMNMRDQQVQVELTEKEKSKQEEKPRHPIEPVVTVITPENADSNSSISSTNSSSTDVLIDVSKKSITVVPKESCRKISKEALATPAMKVSNSTSKTPVKISFEPANGNSSFQVGGLIIDAEKKEITVLTKKRKTSKSSTRMESPAHSEKSHSLPGSRSNSPVAPLPKSAPSSRQSSPKKSHPQTVAPPQPSSADTASRTPNQQKRYRAQITQVTIDSSTESSQLNSTSDASNSALYTRFTAMSQSFSKVPDTSDASTTYRSPPAAVAGSLLHAMSGSTPILELLDCSSNESLRRRAREVSPVSSPETPSPRTVLLPSNRPKPGMPTRRLKFTSLLANKQVKQTDGRGAGDPKVTRIKEVPTRDMYAPAFSSTQNSTILTKTNSQTQTSRTCTCSDPGCRLLHEKIEDTQAYALKHWPEIVKKYEDLQNVCSERIVSLTDLIQKVRNEQRGLELSVVTNEESKSNSTSQVMPTSQSSSVGGNVSKLVKNIDSIHARLKRTLVESQKIIAGGEGMEISTPYASFRETEKSPSSSVDLSKISSIESLEEYIDKSCKKNPLAGVAVVTVASTKPKIVKDERVNIPLNRFRLGKDSRLSGGAGQTENTTTAEASSKPTIDPAPSVTDQSEVLVEMLSKEILEQSKSINKSVPPDSLKDSDDSILKTSQAHVTKDSTEANKNANSNDDNNQSGSLETSHSDYVPFLAGIPKIPRSLAKSASNSRTRPPVTLISGPYRAETLVSPMHELSTIVEFDTPDTANKSQISTKSPSNKCRKKLVNPDTNSNASSPSKRDLKATKSKPSVQVAPLPAHRSPQFPHNILNKSATKNTEKSPKKSINKSLESLERRKTLLDNSNKSESSESMHSLPDMHIEHLQQSHDNGDSNYEFRISQISEMQSLPDENIDQMIISEICEESKSKTITPVRKLSSEQDLDRGPLLSTSSASFSGLSGVSEITTTPSSDLNVFKCPSSPEEMELALKKWGLGWAIPTLKKTREASALGSSSSSDVTPVNTVARLVSPAKKHHDCTPRDLPEISDVSSISIKHTNKSTEKSVLVRGRTSTPNRLINNSNNNSQNYSDNQSNNDSNNRSNMHSNNDSDHSNDRSNHSNHSNDRSNHSNDLSNHSNDRSNHSNHSNDRSNPSNNRSNPSNDRSNHSNNRSKHSNNRSKSVNDHSNHSNDHLKISDIHSIIPSSLPSNIVSNIPLNVHSDTPLNLYTNTPLNVYSNTPLNAHSDTPLIVQSNSPLNVHSNIASTDDPNIPSKDHANVLTNVNPIISSLDHGDTHSTVRPSIRSNTRSSINSTYRSNDSNDQSNIPTSIPSNISSSVHPTIPSNIPSNVFSNIHANIPSFFPSSIHPNIPTSMPSNVSSNIHTNIPSSIPSNVSSNILSYIPLSMPSNVSSNILSYIPSSMPSNVFSNIHTNIPSSIPSSIPSNVSSNVHPDIPSSIPRTVSSNILSNIPSSHSNIPSNVPSNVHLNDQINIPANNHSNDYSNNYPNYRLSDHPNNQTNNHTHHSNDYPNYRLSDYQNNPSNNRSNNNLNDHSNNYSSDGTISTLGSFSSDFNIVLPNQSSDISIPNISFTNKLG